MENVNMRLLVEKWVQIQILNLSNYYFSAVYVLIYSVNIMWFSNILSHTYM